MKPWYLSKTVWVNVLTLIVAILGLLAGNDLIAQHPQVVAAIASSVAAINVLLRFLTSDALSFWSDR